VGVADSGGNYGEAEGGIEGPGQACWGVGLEEGSLCANGLVLLEFCHLGKRRSRVYCTPKGLHCLRRVEVEAMRFL
jgi:hypothetical protein